MSKIVALRGLGDEASQPPKASLSAPTALLWALSLGTVGYIFWATLQPKKRRKAS
jgi:hypothetical protein